MQPVHSSVDSITYRYPFLFTSFDIDRTVLGQASKQTSQPLHLSMSIIKAPFTLAIVVGFINSLFLKKYDCKENKFNRIHLLFSCYNFEE